MYNITKKCYDALCQPSRRLTAKAVITLADGSLCRLSAADFRQDGIRLSEATSGAGSFDLGAAMMSKLTLTLNNFSDRYSGMRFIGGQVSVMQIGVTLTDNSIEWVPLGVFDIDSVTYSGTAAEIVAYDFLSRADRELPAVACPVTLGNLVRSICTHCGIAWSGEDFLHDDYTVNALPETATCRDVISYIAQIAGCYARMTRDGALTLGWYGHGNMPPWGAEDWLDGGVLVDMTSGDQADGGGFFGYDDPDIDGGQNDARGLYRVFQPKSVKGDQPLTITGLRYAAEDEEKIEADEDGSEIIRTVPGQSYLCGTEDYVFDLSDNPLLTHDIPDVLAAIGNRLIGDSFSPLTLSCMSTPALEAGDIVTAADRRGHIYTAFVNRLEYRFGAPLTLSCETQSAAEVKAVRYSAVSRLAQRLRTDTNEKINAYQQRVQALNNLVLNAMGVYKSVVQNDDGSVTYYTHDKPTLEASSYISCETAGGFAYTNSGWNNGAPVWQYGMTADGNIICRVLSAVGIVADWIQAGRIQSADGSCYFDLDSNQLFANKIGLPKRYLSAGEISTDAGESRAGIACHDEELSNSAYFQLRPVKAAADQALYGFGFFDQMGRAQVICTSRSDDAANNSVILYGYDTSGTRRALLIASAVNGGVRLSSLNGQNLITVTDNGISIYKNGSVVQSW